MTDEPQNTSQPPATPEPIAPLPSSDPLVQNTPLSSFEQEQTSPINITTVEPYSSPEPTSTQISASQPTSVPTPEPEVSVQPHPEQTPPETTTAQNGGLSETPNLQPESIPTSLPETSPETPTLAPESLPESQQSSNEQNAEQTIETRTPTEAREGSPSIGVPRELNEEEKEVLYRSRLKTLSVKGNQSRSARRLANHAKIIEYLKQYGYITNNEVEKICDVKNPTAWKYLKELEELNLIIQLGERGKYVRYRLRQAI